MQQSYAILVLASPSSQSSKTALDFSKALLKKGHALQSVFFYHEGVLHGSSLSVKPQDEQLNTTAWQEFIEAEGISAHICIASALKRGILDQQEADRYEKPAHNLYNAFQLSGLGLWVEAANTTDKQIVFGTS